MHSERITRIVCVVSLILGSNSCFSFLIPDITANVLVMTNNSFNKSANSESSLVYAEVHRFHEMTHSLFTKLSEEQTGLLLGVRSHTQILIEEGLPEVIEAVVVHSEKQLCSSALRQKLGLLVNNLSSRIPTKIKIGLGYSHTLAECAHLADPELMQHVSLLVVQVDFGERPTCLPEAYRLFVDFMLQLRTKMTTQIHKGERSVAEVETMYKLSLESRACFPNRSKAVLEAYQGVLATFSEAFASEANMSIIVDPNILKWKTKVTFSDKNHEPFLLPALNSQLNTGLENSSRSSKYPSLFEEVPLHEYRKHKCTHYLPDVLQLIRKQFRQLYVTAFQWAEILECVEQGFLTIVNEFDVLLVRIFRVSHEGGRTLQISLSRISELISNHLKKLRFTELKIIFMATDLTGFSKSFSDRLKNLIHTWKMNVSFVGELYLYNRLDSDEENWHETSLNELVTRQSATFQDLAGVYWGYHVVLKGKLDNGIDIFWKSVRPDLEKLLKFVNSFRRDHPHKAVGIRVFMTSLNMDGGALRSNIYCEGSTTRLSKFVDAVANWGRLNNVTLILNEAVTYNNGAPMAINRLGWWNILRFPRSLKWPRHLEFADGYFPGEDGFSKVKTCIPRSVDVAPFGVQFLSGMASATLNLTAFGWSLHLKEIEMMLRFTFHKFDVVELIIGRNSLEYVTVLTEIFRTPNLFEVGKGDRVREVFAEISISEMKSNVSRSAELIDALKMMIAQNAPGLVVRGIHLNVDDESDLGATFRAVFAPTEVAVGITLRDCVELVNCFNSKCANHSILHNFTYVVCDLPRMPPSNENGVLLAETLEGHLYVHRILKRFVPELKVIFRLNTNSLGSYAIQKYLALINEVQSFSSVFKVDFFLANSVGYSDDNVSNWWEVDPVVNLADQNAYEEVESRYLNRSSWRPFKAGQQSELAFFSRTILIIIGVTFGLVSFVIIVGYALLLKYPKNITGEEVLAYLGLSGWISDDEEDDTRSELVRKLCVKLKEVEIDWDVLLGAGVFGKVYKASFNEQFVAVKVPTSQNVRGASFRSVVAELKVLCLLGNHENVVEFIGAYTVEIKQGKLYVISAFCENGNLLNYLKSLKTERETNGCTFQALYSLIKFSVEIASGMEYISGKNIVHADLATRNVLLNERNVCKICDFGLSRSLHGNDCDEGAIYVKTGNDPLPWRWMAIESLKCNQFTLKSDVWSYGVTVWGIFTLGQVPYSGIFSCDGFEERLEEGLRLSHPELAPIEAWKIMESCWDTEPENRPSFTSLVSYFWSLMRSDYDTI